MRRFGLIGYPLSHSFSQQFFTEKFLQLHITDCIYENFPLKKIDELLPVLKQHPDLAGLNVTIPYKEQVIPFLSQQSDVVSKTGACNCIRIENGKLSGHNTDVIGFENSLLEKLRSYHRKALVLGTGGAAKAVHFVLDKLGIEYKDVSRTASGSVITYQQINMSIIKEHLLIINTSPVGMYPNTEEYPLLPYSALTSQHYLFDLIYNPAKTQFLQKGEERGAAIKNGLDMLVIQAEESWRIWNKG